MEYHYRIWWIRNVPNKPYYYYVTSPEEGAGLINGLTNLDLGNSCISSNACGMETFIDGEWIEWYDENGEDVGVLADKLLR